MMISRSRNPSLVWLFAPFLALSPFWPEGARAQTISALPDYVIEEFGEPPPVPESPFPASLQAAMQVAFVDSFTQSR